MLGGIKQMRDIFDAAKKYVKPMIKSTYEQNLAPGK